MELLDICFLWLLVVFSWSRWSCGRAVGCRMLSVPYRGEREEIMGKAWGLQAGEAAKVGRRKRNHRVSLRRMN